MLRGLVQEHAAATHSRYAAMLLHDWQTESRHFWMVVPREFVRYLPAAFGAEASPKAFAVH